MLTEKEKEILAEYETDFAMPKWKYFLVYGFSFGILLTIINVIVYLVFGVAFSELIEKRLWDSPFSIPLTVFLPAWIYRLINFKSYQKLKVKAGSVA